MRESMADRVLSLQLAVQLASSLELPGSGDAAADETTILAERFKGYLLGERPEKQRTVDRG